MGKALDAYRARKNKKIDNKHELKMAKIETGQTRRGVQIIRSDNRADKKMYKQARIAEGFKYGFDSSAGSVFKNLFDNTGKTVSSIYGKGSYSAGDNYGNGSAFTPNFNTNQYGGENGYLYLNNRNMELAASYNSIPRPAYNNNYEALPDNEPSSFSSGFSTITDFISNNWGKGLLLVVGYYLYKRFVK